jgi:hypothetical protein
MRKPYRQRDRHPALLTWLLFAAGLTICAVAATLS